jgi:hypothetical protein
LSEFAEAGVSDLAGDVVEVQERKGFVLLAIHGR